MGALTSAQASDVVGSKVSIASGWAGISAASDGNNFLIALESDTTAAKVAAQLISPDGTRIGLPIALGHDGQSCCAAGVAFDGTNYLVVWEDDQGIKNSSTPFSVHGRFVSASGVPVAPELTLTTAGIEFDGVSMLAYAGGKYLLTYTRLITPQLGETSTNRYIAGRLIAPDGTLGAEFRISSGFGARSGVTTDGSNFLVVWGEDQYDYEVRARLVTPAGALLQEVSVNASAAPSDNPVLAAFDGSNYMVVWNDLSAMNLEGHSTEGHAYAQRVSAVDATLVGSVITVSTDQGKQVPTGLGFDGNNYVAIWTDMTNPSNWDMYGQFVGKDGTLVGNKFTVDTGGGNQIGGVGCAGVRCFVVISSGVTKSDGGPSQVGEVYAAYLTSSATTDLRLAAGWNLVGNSVNAPLMVATVFGDADKVATVWKWVASGTTPSVTYPSWAFYSPAQSDAGQAFAASKGYEFLSTINGGEGFWVNAKTAFSAQLPAGAAITSASFQNLSSGWHLIATGDTQTPSTFNTALSLTPPGPGAVPQNVTSLWAWDSTASKWYFYAPSLQAQSANALTDYISANGYEDFTQASKTLGSGVGFWVNKP